MRTHVAPAIARVYAAPSHARRGLRTIAMHMLEAAAGVLRSTSVRVLCAINRRLRCKDSLGRCLVVSLAAAAWAALRGR